MAMVDNKIRVVHFLKLEYNLMVKQANFYALIILDYE